MLVAVSQSGSVLMKLLLLHELLLLVWSVSLLNLCLYQLVKGWVDVCNIVSNSQLARTLLLNLNIRSYLVPRAAASIVKLRALPKMRVRSVIAFRFQCNLRLTYFNWVPYWLVRDDGWLIFHVVIILVNYLDRLLSCGVMEVWACEVVYHLLLELELRVSTHVLLENGVSIRQTTGVRVVGRITLVLWNLAWVLKRMLFLNRWYILLLRYSIMA